MKRQIAKAAVRDFLGGRYCGEVVIDHVGRAVIPGFDPSLARIGTGFVGGIANGGGVCGTVAGAVVIIGLLVGRCGHGEDARRCLRLTRKYRERFTRELGSLDCRDLAKRTCGFINHRACARLVAKGIILLMELLVEEGLWSAPTSDGVPQAETSAAAPGE